MNMTTPSKALVKVELDAVTTIIRDFRRVTSVPNKEPLLHFYEPSRSRALDKNHVPACPGNKYEREISPPSKPGADLGSPPTTNEPPPSPQIDKPIPGVGRLTWQTYCLECARLRAPVSRQNSVIRNFCRSSN